MLSEAKHLSLWSYGLAEKLMRFFSHGCGIRMTIPLTTIYRFNALTNHVPSVRGLSPPAIDSRMEVSAWTFFIRT